MNRIKAIIQYPELLFCDVSPNLIDKAKSILASVKTPDGRVWVLDGVKMVKGWPDYCLLTKDCATYHYTKDELLDFVKRTRGRKAYLELMAKL